MKTTYVMVFVLWLVCSTGCEVKAKIAINSEQTDEYAEHYKHRGDLFYKGTFVLKETAASVLNMKGNTDPSLRTYRVLGTDIEFQADVVGTELPHNKLLTLRRQGFRIVIE